MKCEATLEGLRSRHDKETLTLVECAKELSVSKHTLYAYISNGKDLPNYVKLGNAKNGRIIFPIVEVAKFLSNTQKIFNNGYQ